jgi:hypothetical protein
MPSARRAAPPSAFPELAAARGRRARREALTSLLMLALVAGFIAFALLMFGTLVRGVLWLASAVWDYLPGLPSSPDALALLLVRMLL